MDLLIIRHGRPERVEGASGTADPGLTSVGHDQARAVAHFLSDERIDHIVSSPMLRARETAGPLSQLFQLPIEVIDDLAEIDKDAQHYVPIEERRAEAGDDWAAIVENPTLIHGDVDIEAFADTVTNAFEDVIAANPSRSVAVFCHGMVTMQFLRRTLGYDDVHGLRTDYASITRVQASSSRQVRTIRSVNETAHLGSTRIVSP